MFSSSSISPSSSPPISTASPECPASPGPIVASKIFCSESILNDAISDFIRKCQAYIECHAYIKPEPTNEGDENNHYCILECLKKAVAWLNDFASIQIERDEKIELGKLLTVTSLLIRMNGDEGEGALWEIEASSIEIIKELSQFFPVDNLFHFLWVGDPRNKKLENIELWAEKFPGHRIFLWYESEACLAGKLRDYIISEAVKILKQKYEKNDEGLSEEDLNFYLVEEWQNLQEDAAKTIWLSMENGKTFDEGVVEFLVSRNESRGKLEDEREVILEAYKAYNDSSNRIQLRDLAFLKNDPEWCGYRRRCLKDLGLRNIIQAYSDAMRCLILYRDGGSYFDCDYRPLDEGRQTLEALTAHPAWGLRIDGQEGVVDKYIIGNAAMSAAEIGNPLLRSMFKYVDDWYKVLLEEDGRCLRNGNQDMDRGLDVFSNAFLSEASGRTKLMKAWAALGHEFNGPWPVVCEYSGGIWMDILLSSFRSGTCVAAIRNLSGTAMLKNEILLDVEKMAKGFESQVISNFIHRLFREPDAFYQHLCDSGINFAGLVEEKYTDFPKSISWREVKWGAGRYSSTDRVKLNCLNAHKIDGLEAANSNP